MPKGSFSDLLSALESFRRNPATSVIVSDVDGTLAPIVADPRAARIREDAREALARIVGLYQGLGFLSGRALPDLISMVGLDDVYYVGNHGIELAHKGFRSIDPEVLEALPRLSKLRRAISEAPESRIPGVVVEDKEYTFSIHYRGVQPEQALEVERLADTLAMGYGFHLVKGKKVLELRPFASGGKDHGIKSILSRIAESTGRAVERVVFFGDDVTDIDAFRCLDELSRTEGLLAIAVAVAGGHEQSEAVLDAAGYVVEGTDDVVKALRFLGE